MLIYDLISTIYTNLIDKLKALVIPVHREIKFKWQSLRCHILIEYSGTVRSWTCLFHDHLDQSSLEFHLSLFLLQTNERNQIIIQTTIILDEFAAVRDWYSSNRSANDYSCHSLASSSRCYYWHCHILGALSAADKLDNFEWFVARPCREDRDLTLPASCLFWLSCVDFGTYNDDKAERSDRESWCSI